MSNVKRVKGVTLDQPIVYGSTAMILSKRTDTQHTHRWSIYVRGAQNEDLSFLLRKVSFRLHESFANPLRGKEFDKIEEGGGRGYEKVEGGEFFWLRSVS
jgi:YEATS domain-containing protein 4